MIYLLLAICSTAMVSVTMRLSNSKVKNEGGMLTMNYLMCTALAAVYAGVAELGPLLHITAGLGVLNGILYLTSFALLQRNVRRSGVVLSATFMKLGLLVSIAVSVLFFREMPGLMQTVGFVLAVGAIVLIQYKKESAGGFRAGLIWLLLCGGMADAMSKIFQEVGPAGFEAHFLFFTFLTALGFCVVRLMVQDHRIGKWEVLFGLMVGIPNFFSTRFLLRSLEDLPAVVAYPVYSVGGILLVTLAGVVFFKERLEKRQWLGLGMILAALVLLNI